MNRMCVAACALAIALMFPAGTFAGEGHGKSKGKGGRGVAAQLGMTDDQADKYKAANKDRKDENKAFKETITRLHEKLAGAVDGENAAAIEGILKEISAAKKSHQAKLDAIDAKLAAALTPIQRAKLELKSKKRGGPKGDHDGGHKPKKKKDEKEDEDEE